MTTPIPLHAPAEATFDEFWQLYPSERKAGKPACRAKWNQITNGGLKTRTLDKDSGTYIDIDLVATPAEIMAGLEAWKKTLALNPDYSYRDPQFLPLVSTWLNQGRWEDYL